MTIRIYVRYQTDAMYRKNRNFVASLLESLVVLTMRSFVATLYNTVLTSAG